LGAKGGNTCTGHVGQPFVTCIRDNAEQLFDTMASDRRDDSKLRKVSVDSIDYRSLLADEQVPGSVQCQATLLLWRLGRGDPRAKESGQFYTDSLAR